MCAIYLGNNDSADDMKNVDLTRIHYLSGPFEIENAEPGDVLLVEIMDVQPLPGEEWGLWVSLGTTGDEKSYWWKLVLVSLIYEWVHCAK